MKRILKLSLALVLVALGTFVFIQCQKEGSITPTGKSSSAIVKDNQRTSSSWTYGEPKWYDDLGFPRWNSNYPKVKVLRLANDHIRYIYYYSKNDASILKQIGPITYDTYLDPNSDGSGNCDPNCKAWTGIKEKACNCGEAGEVIITGRSGKPVKCKISVILFEDENLY